MRRLTAGAPVHPISRYLAALPRAGAADFAPLDRSHAMPRLRSSAARRWNAARISRRMRSALCAAVRLALASRLAGEVCRSKRPWTLSRGHWRRPIIWRARLRDYRREARAGRVPFAVDELLAAGVGQRRSRRRPSRPPHLRSIWRRCAAAPRGYFEVRGRRRCRAPSAARQRHLLDSGGARAELTCTAVRRRAVRADCRICCSPGATARARPSMRFGARN